ncbi:hypothetical protein LCGC14_0732030 [marine sediment metagenome]|uniref:Uncharacterized protein n=1 Tax=marine sediment metagenome TaxID=412755 RepID=A0A0F9QU90_9ZZZZ
MMNEIVKVTWIDAQRLELGVIQVEELPDIKPIPCDIIGFKVHEDKERIVIAQERWIELGGCKYVHVIPKCSIVKIIKLQEVKNGKPRNIRTSSKGNRTKKKAKRK